MGLEKEFEHSISLVLMSESFLSSLCLPVKLEGKYSFTMNNSRQCIDFLSIESTKGYWRAVCKKQAYIKDINQQNFEQALLQDRNFLHIYHKEMECVLYTEVIGIQQKIFKNYFVQNNSSLLVGRSDECDVWYQSNFVTRQHARLQYIDRMWVIEDLGSKNGVFVDGIRIKAGVAKRLSLGNKISILGIQIIIGTNFLSINGGDRICINPSKLYTIEKVKNYEDVKYCKDIYTEKVFNRLPWQRKKHVINPIEIEAPPLSMNSNQMPLILRMGSSMVMGGSAMMSGHYASVLSMLLFPMLSSRYTDKEKKEYEKERTSKYREYLRQKGQEIQNEKYLEEMYFNEAYPDTNKLLEYMKSKEKLWGRRKTDSDFLHIRIGKGKKNLLAEIQYPQQRFSLEEDELEQEMYDLVKEKVVINNIPILLRMTENYISSIIGNEELKIQIFTYILAQIIFWHSYDEVKLIFLIDDTLLKRFDYIRYFPHTWDDEKTFRFIATDASTGYLVGEYLNHQIQEDIGKARELSQILKSRPYYMVLAWNKHIFDSLEILRVIQNEDKNVGVSILTFFEEIPQTAHELIMLKSSQQNKITYLKNPDDGIQFFEFDSFERDSLCDMMRDISNVTLREYEKAFVLPKMLPFLEMLEVGKIEHLNVTKRWRENNPSKSLAVPVGLATDGGLFMLDLHEKYQGPHGLVAGMTGSGKSEFLITYILSMAVNFHPDEVSFVLIDYKGGGLAGAFEDSEKGIHLPHLAGTITNLDGVAIQRSLMSIESEMKKRQRIFNEVKSANDEGTMDIYMYQTLYRAGKVKEPLPHLFIISDEFAELKSQEPEFMDHLISAARIGRSLGIHLILATQKPSGVVNDQINSNSKFRVCLKVQTRADSDEMLQRPEAAEIKETGRFYLQVGYNEFFAMGQSAWCGAPYEPQDEVKETRDDTIQFLDDMGQSIFQIRPEKEKISDGRSQLVAIVRYLTSVAEREGVQKSLLWMNPLPKCLSLQGLLKKYSVEHKNSMQVTVGIVDDPENQAQYPYVLNIRECKNFLIIGGNRSGKTTFIQSILYALVYNYRPEDINFYILDFSSKLLNVFDKAPHCGGVWTEEEQKDIEKLFDMLNRIIMERKSAFTKAEVNSFEAYREIEKIPFIVVIIDNCTGLSSWPAGKEIYQKLNLTVREANAVGIKFIMSANNMDDVLYVLKKEFEDRVAFNARNRFEFGDIVGAKCEFLPEELPGHGLCKFKERALEFLVASYQFDGTEQQKIQRLKQDIVRNASEKYAGCRCAPTIPQLNREEDYETFCMDIELERIPLGYELQDYKKISMPLEQLYCMGVYLGNKNSVAYIISNFLYAIYREGMELILVKKSSNSIFDSKELKQSLSRFIFITILKNTLDDGMKLWDIIANETKNRSVYRDEFADENGISLDDIGLMKVCASYIRKKTSGLFVIFEDFEEFSDILDEKYKKGFCNIFMKGKGYNYYFIGCHYPKESMYGTLNDMQKIFLQDEFVILQGGQFNRQSIVELPQQYINIKKATPNPNSCIMQYHGEVYPIWMPMKQFNSDDAELDLAPII